MVGMVVVLCDVGGGVCAGKQNGCVLFVRLVVCSGPAAAVASFLPQER